MKIIQAAFPHGSQRRLSPAQGPHHRPYGPFVRASRQKASPRKGSLAGLAGLTGLASLLLFSVLWSTCLAGPAAPEYRIYPLRNGVCKIAGNHAYHNGDNAETYDYALFIWLVLGGDKPMLVDAGISNIEEMNRGAAHVLREPITQHRDETIRVQLGKFGLKPDDIGRIFITHLHFDHVDDLLEYKNATVYIGRKEWEGALAAAPTWGHGKILHEFSNNPDCKKRLVVVDDGQILPGIEAFWVGGHTPGSTAYCVNTAHGRAVFTGDTVSLLGNIEKDIPPGVYTSLDECMAAMKKIREKADIILPSHDPGTLDRWPPAPENATKYTIRAIKVGQCEVRDYITFQDTDSEATSTFYLYVWVIEGGPKPIVVETGPKYPEEFSRSTEKYIPGGVKQFPSERTIEALKRCGIDPAEVSHVIATHLHADHYDYFDAFPNAKLVVNEREYKDMTDDRDRLAPDVRKALNEGPDALMIVGDNEEIVPGIRALQLGCHTPGSQGVLVRTWMGPALLAGDAVYKYENIEKDRPTRSPDPQICSDAMTRIRSLADIVLPGHDPLTLERWPKGVIGGLPPSGTQKIESLTLITGENISQPLKYAIEQFTSFCLVSAQINVRQSSKRIVGPGLTVLLGRGPAEQHASAACEQIDWEGLGAEGFVLRAHGDGGQQTVIAAGATDMGTRQAVYALMRELDVGVLPATLDSDLDIIEKPSFPLRGMYAHQHWAYAYPYGLRTWTIDEWKSYVDILALMRVNLFQIWSMAGILPTPFSPEDEAFLRRYPPVIEHARLNHGMEVWIGECANNVCESRDLPPPAQRDYFRAETLKNPADPQQMAQLEAARAEFYKVCNNADGYWVIDSDPGGFKGSTASQFVDIMMMNRRLIDRHALLGPKAKLIYWMWFGWGNKEQERNWLDVAGDLAARSPEPWLLTVASDGHWKVADQLNLTSRTIYYPYGAVEPEPSLPFTTVVPDILKKALDVTDRVGSIRGAMGNAQTPICQLPNIYYFTRAIWDIERRDEPPYWAIYELARLVYPERAALLSQAWLSLGHPDAPDAETLADKLETIEKAQQLGRPGPIGIKLFPDLGQVTRDLTAQLRIHAAAVDFCKMAEKSSVDESELFDRLARYCLLSLEWRRHTGFRNYGTNGYDFFPLRTAAHKRWWRENRLNPEIQRKLTAALAAQYEDWEVNLIMYPLTH